MGTGTYILLTDTQLGVCRSAHRHTHSQRHIGDYLVSVLLFLSDKHTPVYTQVFMSEASSMSPICLLLLCTDAMAQNCACLQLLLKVI